ncbi:hypothetical protein [Antarcticirhabdus aurantiaca]|uniref:hypothetical protein n=1 Tax=Antarcticirhabdus aurantiaca TaxID=2606717 RepID=UPI00131B1FC5|nr:hypothetical protein [Antarcticirhabdus aurantiaca]
MDHRILIGAPNRLDGAALSGGSWAAGMPLSNLKTREFSRRARSTDTTPAAATFTLDFGKPRELRILALIAHNCSLTAKVRYEVSEASNFSTRLYDVTVDVWGGFPTAPWDINALEWENDNFWLGTYDQEDLEGFTPTSSHIMPAEITGRYLRVTILDELNDDDFVEVGRVFAGPAVSPTINYAWGGTLGYEIATAVEQSLGGNEFFDVREPVRIFRFALQHLTDDEGFGIFLELVRRYGVHGEVFIVPEPLDAFNGIRRNFLGRMRQPGALEQVGWMNGGSAHSIAFEIKELR